MKTDVVRVLLKPKEDREINQGFPWVFDNEIGSVKFNAKDGSGIKTASLEDCQVEDGSVVEVCTSAGGFLGTGIINRKSKITIRIFSREHADKIMEDTFAYWDKVIRNAVNIRALSFTDYDSCRLVFAEADFVPGFICERYVDDGHVYLVVQFLALACEVFRKEILKALENTCKPCAIFERSDAQVREKEGLEEKSGWIGKAGKEIITITENEIKIEVDIAHGQKTGYFLDQKFNRARVAQFCHGKKVLDTFTHTGAFGLNAFKAGAREVVSVDISEDAVNLVERNIKNNGAEKVVKAVCADVFDVLKKYETDGEKFDVIILDPPAFTKKAKSIEKAYGGYKEINLRAMRILNEGGILVTCSCSHYFDENTFYDMIMHAAKDSHKRVQVLEKRGAAPDHPILLGYPKSEYLKCAICRVL
ncbi:MAG: class I SAM-dependent rRNA methyltransferase [Treponema sp.]|nr:class I SAM-dependent rRNA methyltransferase [Spirochaetia bacterium]MDD7460717.1 class I SAM-dependent rRNA methyltransferase [Spirochaetales bacterium]MDY5812289.1 class I SAM-dependent rRNA methyltransferase [Treponema sp.]MEE1181078.1 class I SAM-dependent rRNA methyltransferase [Treponema sp.]